MAAVPSLEELGIEEKPGENVDERFNAALDKASERRRRVEYSALNGALLISLAFPALAAMLLFGRGQMGFFYYMVSIWVHEAGHGFWCLLGDSLLCPLGGFLNEMLVTIPPALICFRRREAYIAGCVLVMCAGLSLEYNGVYMQSAGHPRGVGFAGVPMTTQTHDWSRVFRQLGLVDESFDTGFRIQKLGSGLAFIFLTASLAGLLADCYGRVPRGLSDVVSPAALMSAVYFTASGPNPVEFGAALILSAPLLLKAGVFLESHGRRR